MPSIQLHVLGSKQANRLHITLPERTQPAFDRPSFKAYCLPLIQLWYTRILQLFLLANMRTNLSIIAEFPAESRQSSKLNTAVFELIPCQLCISTILYACFRMNCAHIQMYWKSMRIEQAAAGIQLHTEELQSSASGLIRIANIPHSVYLKPSSHLGHKSRKL